MTCCRWLGAGLTVLLAGLAPARALIVPARADAEADLKAEAASHEAGARHPAVAGIYLTGGKLDLKIGLGTGIYVGASADGRKGLVLTAAHLFEHDPDHPGPLPYEGVDAVFGADPAESKALVRVPALRVLLHPDYSRSHHGRLPGARGRRDPRPSTRDDVALVEFDLARHGAGLEAAGIAPALLHEAGAHRGLEGQAAAILGFGSYVTTRTALRPDNERLHLGHTRVTHGDYCGREVLMNLAPLSLPAVARFLDGDPDFNLLNRFEAQLRPREVYLRHCSSTQWLLTHPDQVVPAPGDSGGPLLVEAADGTPRVAGICSWSVRQQVQRAPWRKRLYEWALVSIFEPVGLHRDWIEQVRAGKAGGRAWVLEPGDGHWRATAPEPADTCSLCVVM